MIWMLKKKIRMLHSNIEMYYNVWFQKYPYPHHRGSLEIPRRGGRGVLKAKIFK